MLNNQSVGNTFNACLFLFSGVAITNDSGLVVCNDSLFVGNSIPFIGTYSIPSGVGVETAMIINSAFILNFGGLDSICSDTVTATNTGGLNINSLTFNGTSLSGNDFLFQGAGIHHYSIDGLSKVATALLSGGGTVDTTSYINEPNTITTAVSPAVYGLIYLDSVLLAWRRYNGSSYDTLGLTSSATDTQILYNDSGAVVGSSNLTYDSGTSTMTIGADLIPTTTGTYQLGRAAKTWDGVRANFLQVSNGGIQMFNANQLAVL